MKNQPAVSIIVPVYNVEAYLRSCLDSILSQTFTNWECILIDDGSPDTCGDICDEYSRLDSRFRVIHQSNAGVSVSRNRGLDAARGRWILFVDSDDMLTPGGLSTLCRLATSRSDCQFVMAGHIMVENGAVVSAVPPRKERQLVASRMCMLLFRPEDFEYLGFVTPKMFLKDIIAHHNLRFDEAIKYNEDRLFTFNYLRHIAQGVFSTECVYVYNRNGSGAMAAIHGPGFWKFEDDLDAMVKMSATSTEFQSPELTELVYRETYTSYCWNRRLNRQYGGNNKETNRRLRAKVRRAIPRNRLYLYDFNRRKGELRGWLGRLRRRITAALAGNSCKR